MSKIEQMHLDTMIVKDLQSAVRSAEITEQIAIEFWAWMRENDTPDNAEQYSNYTDKDMFQEFLKTKQ